jgi:hypothetical protein
MIFEKSETQREGRYLPKAFETKKLTWKDKFKRELFRENLKQIQTAKARRKREIKE